MTELTQDEVMNLIKKEMTNVDRDRVYFVLRDMKLRRILNPTVDTVVACVALHRLGLPITSELVTLVRPIQRNNNVTLLHFLGDKNVLTLIRGRASNSLFWMLSETFKRKMGL
jgi:hypothetical protein